ncbi:MAG: ribonuclease Y [Candidatus Pacebacteria bacterium]|nr:ribonuclease Y [Candidatus Paceibacterota bacterium]NUQ56904.1 ribonuclease Y [Candidatus Paceibacter sp.]
MDLTKVFLLAGFSGFGGLAIGYFFHVLLTLQKKNSVDLKTKQLLLEAKDKAQNTLEDAGKKAQQILDSAKNEEKNSLLQVRKLEERVLQREENLEKQRVLVEKGNAEIQEKLEKLKKKKEEFEVIEKQKLEELQKVASLTDAQAKEELLKLVEKKSEEDILGRMKKLEAMGRDEFERKARDILISSIQRLASSTASEVTTTTVPIPSDDLKGKIIGKEGRNIRALERAAGVEIIVDDTPGSIVISGFDPIRRQTAKMALENLVLDGRIQPARIEEVVEKARMEVDKTVKQKGEMAAYEAGIIDLDPRLLAVLGRLYFRTSYGQNVLQHSVEAAHLAGLLAAELKADVNVAKKGALLHDIGKAMDHEVQGTHVDIGRRILQKFNVDEKIIKAMQAHHEEHPFETVESVIVQVADAISGARPGARRDSLENYLKRLEDLENITKTFEGIEKSYAIQAGREIRVFVVPEKISDLEAKKMARDIADRIERDLKYPGEIKVTVIRENRVVEYAR